MHSLQNRRTFAIGNQTKEDIWQTRLRNRISSARAFMTMRLPKGNGGVTESDRLARPYSHDPYGVVHTSFRHRRNPQAAFGALLRYY